MLAVLIVGEERGLSGRKNDVIGASPAETWSILHDRSKARFFACMDRPIEAPLLTQQWAFDAPSQFARLRDCLLRVESSFPRQHRAFLRIRPDFLAFAPFRQRIEANAFLGKYYYYPGYLGRGTAILFRDQVSCGMCDKMCECAQRKYGQILYKFASDTCRWPIVTDQVFAFGREVLPRMLAVLRNFSDPASTHPARSPSSEHHCIRAGRMVETGFSRLLEDHAISVGPLSLRGVLERALRADTPGWASVACMLTWANTTSAPRCSDDCGHTRGWLYHRGFDTFPTLQRVGGRGCNLLDRYV